MAEKGLFNIDYRPPYHPWGPRGSVSPSHMKALFVEIFDPERVYTFFRTVTNPAATKLLEGYFGERKEFGADWDVHKKRNGATPCPQPDVDRRALHFDPFLRRKYLGILEMLSKKEFGAENYRDFALVDGAFSMDTPPEALSWPHIHVIKGRKAVDRKYFEELVNLLIGNEAHAMLRKQEEPQNYRTGEIDTLHATGVNPLVLEDRMWVCKGTDLRESLDFLMPFSWNDGQMRDHCPHCED